MTTLQRSKQSTPIDVPRGVDLLNCPVRNKATAFTQDERRKLGLHGLLPPQVESLDEQAARAYEAYERKDDDLERHIYLRALQDTNEVLYAFTCRG
jgi:malate dehydrogenase (oxaloacetate-decarboxylating)